MENRDRDEVSRSTEPAEAGEVNREVSEREGREHDSIAEFGQKVLLVDLSGRSEGNH